MVLFVADDWIKRGKTIPKIVWEVYPDLTLKDVNDNIEDMGYRLEYYGENCTNFTSLFEIIPLKPFFGRPDYPFIEVWGFRNYTPKQYRMKLWRKLAEPKEDGVNLHQRTERRMKWRKYSGKVGKDKE